MHHTNSIKGKLCLITGASGGIGAACARRLAPRGVHLALTYSSNVSTIEALVAGIQKEYIAANPHEEPLTITIHKADLASADETIRLCKEVQDLHGRTVDILVSNAGYGKRIKDIWDIPIEEFDHTLNVNLRAAFLLVKGVVEGMKAQKWGRIIFVSSIAAYGAGLNGCHYAASKAGLIGMMKNLSSNLGQYNITVNDVAPAMVGSTGLLPNEGSVPGLVDTIPLRRLCQPEEVANCVYMFATTGFATGQSVVLSGGLMHK